MWQSPGLPATWRRVPERQVYRGQRRSLARSGEPGNAQLGTWASVMSGRREPYPKYTSGWIASRSCGLRARRYRPLPCSLVGSGHRRRRPTRNMLVANHRCLAVTFAH